MRFAFAAVAWLGLAAAAAFLVRSEQQLTETRTAATAFDRKAREAATALSDLRAAQEAYVAAGQGIAYWMPRAGEISVSASAMVTDLANSATTQSARDAAAEASKALSDFATIDKRARDYIKADQELMAADVIFTEGGPTLAAAAQEIELARLGQREAEEDVAARERRRGAVVAGAAAAVAGLVLLALAPRPKVADARFEPAATNVGSLAPDIDALPLREPAPSATPEAAPPPDAAPSTAAADPALAAAAEICAGLARARDAADLPALLARAADLLDAKGLIVWLAGATSEDLRPVFAHGYPAQILAKMPAVTRSADNAAANAYRTGEMQIVRSRTGDADGAIVAPLVAADGCFGAFTAEVRHGAEGSPIAQAFATIVAAQLATIIGPQTSDLSETRVASARV